MSKTRQTTMKFVRTGLCLALGAGMVACGGGGGGGDDPPPSLAAPLDITLANRDSVAHATAAGVMALGTAGALPIAGSSGTTVAGTVHRMSAAGLASAGRQRALAVIGPMTEPCTAGGTMSMSVDDRDDNGMPSVGDVMTMSFAACREAAGEEMDGSATITFTRVANPPAGFGARMAMNQLSATSNRHTMRLDGAVLFDFTESAALVQTMSMSTDGPLTIAVSTPVFTDTVTLASGYTQDSITDPRLVPPGGGTAGRTLTALNGRMESTRAGGSVSLATGTTPLLSYTDDAYARSGSVLVNGRSGAMRLSPLPTAQVLIELDQDGNGSFESSSTVTWDWLL